VVWQSPANDWGEQAGGYDLRAANALVFKARGETGTEVIGAGVGIIGPDKPYADSSMTSRKDLALSREWQEFRIPLSGRNLSAIKSGFYWTTGGKAEPVVFYLDDIAFVFDPQAPPASTENQPNPPPAAGGAISSPRPSGPVTPGAAATLPLQVYGEGGPLPYIPSGYMGNHAAIKMDDKNTESPYAGATCLRVDYTASDNWGGVVWQSPANDWGDQPGGYNLTGAGALEFWVRGARGGETVNFGVGLIGSDKPYGDTGKAERKGVVLSTAWQKIVLPLAGQDLSRIKSGFYWTSHASGQPFTFYLDDIRFVAQGAAADPVPVAASAAPVLSASPGRPATLPLTVYAEPGELPYIPSGYMGNHGAISMDDKNSTTPHAGAACLKVTYGANDNWGGVVWQHPHNDWGDQPGGYNLTGAGALEFWARGEYGGEKVSFGFGLVGAPKTYFDTGKGELKDVSLTTTWQRYCIPLAGRDLSRIKSGFYWTLGAPGQPVTFYLDDIRYVTTPCQ
jgi:hypothetical protein